MATTQNQPKSSIKAQTALGGGLGAGFGGLGAQPSGLGDVPGKDPPLSQGQPLFSGNPFQFKGISKPAGLQSLQSLEGGASAEAGKLARLAGLPQANLKKLGEQ